MTEPTRKTYAAIRALSALALTAVLTESGAAAPLAIGQAVEVVTIGQGDGILIACPNKRGPGSGEDYGKLLYPDGDGPVKELDWDSRPAREYRDKYGCRSFAGGSTGIVRAIPPYEGDPVCVAPTTTVGADGYLIPGMPPASARCYWIMPSNLKTCKRLKPPTLVLPGPPVPPSAQWLGCVDR
jgi:hypothetical protein